jgi:hypothetical protein
MTVASARSQPSARKSWRRSGIRWPLGSDGSGDSLIKSVETASFETPGNTRSSVRGSCSNTVITVLFSGMTKLSFRQQIPRALKREEQF